MVFDEPLKITASFLEDQKDQITVSFFISNHLGNCIKLKEK